MNPLTYRSVEAKDAWQGFFDPFLEELTRLSAFVLVVHGGVSHLRKRLPELRERVSQKHVPQLENLGSFVDEVESTGFSYLFEIAVVRLWTVLETVVNELVAFLLQNTEEAMTDKVRKIKMPLADFIDATDDERATLLTKELRQKVASRNTPGVGVFENVLNAVGFGGPVHDDVGRQLMELSEIRHVVVHTNGLADRKLAERCPWLGVDIGNRVPLTEQKYYGYYHAAYWYILELMRRRVERDGEDATEEVSFQDSFLQRLREGNKGSN